MGFSINTNINAMTANLNANLSNNGVNSSVGRLSSGSQINSAADNASGMAISNELSAQVSGMGQMIMNANDSIGMLQIADGAMSGISDNMDRIRELTMRAGSGIMNADNKAAIQQEIDALLQSSADIVSQTSYNGINVLSGDSISGNTQSFSKSDSLISAIDVTSGNGITGALNAIEQIYKDMNNVRSDIGSTQNQLMSDIRNMSITKVNTAAAESQVKDLDFAEESANFNKQNLMTQAGSFAQAQSNARASNIMSLLS